jgi:hypothetical protein
VAGSGVGKSNGLELNKATVDEDKSAAEACLPIEGLLECRRRPSFQRKRFGRFQKCVNPVCLLVLGFQ